MRGRGKAILSVLVVVGAVAFAGVAALLALSSGNDKVQKNTTAIKGASKQATKAVVKSGVATKKATGAQKTGDKALGLGIATLKCLAKPTQERQRVCLGVTSGAQGPAGDIGPRGPSGQSAIGKRGPQGPEGGPGPASTTPGPKGDSVKGDQGDAGLGYDCAGNQVKPGDAPAKCPGEKGADGKDGQNGADGQPGANGADSTVPGPTGPAGAPCPNQQVITTLDGPVTVCVP